MDAFDLNRSIDTMASCGHEDNSYDGLDLLSQSRSLQTLANVSGDY